MHESYLKTERLVLRPYRLEDAPAIHTFCSDWDVAKTLLNVPYPYTLEDAQSFLQSILENENPNAHRFAITLKSDDTLIGAIGMGRNEQFNHAEIGYWIGKPYWKQGYASEAVRRFIQFGFEELALNRIYAGFFSENIASRRVMEKSGMSYEGLFRQHYYRWDQYYDVGYCGIIREDWEERSP